MSLFERLFRNVRNTNGQRRKKSFSASIQLEKLEDRHLLSGDGIAPLDSHILFAPDTSAEVVASYEQNNLAQDANLTGLGPIAPFNFGDNDRWSNTATDGVVPSIGEPVTLTWSLVPDSTSIFGYNDEDTSDSELVAFFDGIYGNGGGGSDLTLRPWFSQFTSVFDRWSELTGITYVYEPNDDGSAWTENVIAPGVVGVRGDIRIAGHPIDGNSNVLAYNFFPNAGDMVIDTGDSFFSNTSNNSIRLRNVLAHEAGHGIGLGHSAPTNQTKLLEPTLTTAFDGPQFDDILAMQRGYGDAFEANGGNDTAATAIDLGAIGGSVTASMGTDATDVTVDPGNVYVNGDGETDFLSIDGSSDIDFFSFSVDADASVSVVLTPLGPSYASDGSTFDSASQSNLLFEIIADDGITVLHTQNNAGLGESESLVNFLAPQAGTYFVSISGIEDAAQFYQLDVSAQSVVPAAIFGRVWIDNGNGQRDVGELAHEGVIVFLDANNNGLLDAGETNTTSAADGSYSFQGLTPGTYTVAEIIPAGYEQTYPGTGNGSQPLQLVSIWDGQTSGDGGGAGQLNAPLPHEDIDKGAGGVNEYADVWAVGNYGYIGHFETDSKVDIVDLTNPVNPVLAATWTAPQSGLRIQDVKVVGTTAYFPSDSGGGMYIVDVSDPTNPLTLSHIGTGDGGHDDIHNIYIDGDYLYQVSGRGPTVRVFNVSDASNPTFVRTLTSPSGDAVHDVTVQNGRLYTSVIFGQGTTDIFDVSDVGNSAPLLASFSSGPNSHSSWPTIDDNYLVVAEERSGGAVRIWDISDLGNITEVATMTAASLGINAYSPHNPVIDGNILYVSWYQAGVQMFDITDPTNPVHLGGYDTFTGGVSGFDGNWAVYSWPDQPEYIVAGDMQSGLFVLSTPAVNAHVVTLGVDEVATGTDFGNEFVNSFEAPVLSPIADQFLLPSETLELTLSATDLDTSEQYLVYSAELGQSDAYVLDQTYELRQPDSGHYYENFRGQGEKYLQGVSGVTGWYYILSNGDFYEFTDPTHSSFQGTFITSLDPIYYGVPALLHEALPNSDAVLDVTGSLLTLDPVLGFEGVIPVIVSVSDGNSVDSQEFNVTVGDTSPTQPPVLTQIGDQSILTTEILSLTLSATDPDTPLQDLVFSAQAEAEQSEAYTLDQTYNLRQPDAGHYYQNSRGQGEKYLQGVAGVTGWYYILANGNFYEFTDPSFGPNLTGNFIASLDPIYYNTPTLLHEALPSSGTVLPVTGNLLTLDPDPGFVGDIVVSVTVSDGENTDSQQFTLTVNAAPPSQPPVLGLIADQSIVTTETLSLTLSATDSDTPQQDLVFSAQAIAEQSEAYTLDQTYNLRQPDVGHYYQNSRGQGEKYLQGVAGVTGWYYILANGNFYEFTDPSFGPNLTGNFVASLDPIYYNTPTLLHEALPSSGTVLPVTGNLLTLDPDPGFVGDIVVSVTVSDGENTDSQQFTLTVNDVPPTLPPVLDLIADQSILTTEILSLTLSATDPDTPQQDLVFSAQAVAEQSEAYTLDQTYNLRQPDAGHYYQDARGQGEKYLQGVVGVTGWYYILANGNFYEYTDPTLSSLQGTFIASLDPIYYNTPALLHEALPSSGTVLPITGNLLTLDPDPGFVGDIVVTVTVSDGENSDSQQFTLTVNDVPPSQPPVLDLIADQSILTTETLSLTLSAADPDTPQQDLVFSAQAEAEQSEAYTFDQTYNLRQPDAGHYYQNSRGQGEKYLQGVAGVTGWYYILANGNFYEYTDPTFSSLQGTFIASLDPVYYNTPALLHEALPSSGTVLPVTGNLLTLDPDPGFVGDIVVTVTVSDGENSDIQQFTLTVNDTPPTQPPVLDLIADQSILTTEILSLTLSAADPDTPQQDLVFSAQAEAEQSEAYTLDQTYNLRQPDAGHYYQDARGQGEKYLQGVAGVTGWYYILANGNFYEYTDPTYSTLQGVFIASLDPIYYNNPALLHESLPVSTAVSITGNQLTLEPESGFVGEINVTVTVSDGGSTDSQQFVVTVLATAGQIRVVRFDDFDAKVDPILDNQIRRDLFAAGSELDDLLLFSDYFETLDEI